MAKTPLRPLRRFLTYGNALGGFPLEQDKEAHSLKRTLVLIVWCVVVFTLVFTLPVVVAGVVLSAEGGLSFNQVYFPEEATAVGESGAAAAAVAGQSEERQSRALTADSCCPPRAGDNGTAG